MSKQFYTNLINPNAVYNAVSGTVTNPMTSSLDAGENSIINLPAPSTSGEPVTLAYFNEHAPDTNSFVPNPFTENVDADGNSILNLQSLSMNDAINTGDIYFVNVANGSMMTTNTADSDDRLHAISINEGGTSKPYFTDFRSFPVTNIGQLGFNDGGIISTTNETFQLNHPLDLNNNYIKDVQNIQFFNGGSLSMDSSDNLEYNNDVVITTDNIAQYIQEHNWTGEASSDLHMNTFNINNTNSIQLQQSSAITLNDNDDICYNSEKIVTAIQDIVDSETRELTEYQPTNSLPMTNIALVGNTTSPITITHNYYIQTPCRMNLDLDFTIAGDTPITLNANNVYMIVGLCNDQVYVNSDLQIDFLKIDGTAIKYENGHYTSLINLIMQNGANSDNVKLQGGVTLIESMVDIVAQWQAQANFNPISDVFAYYYVKLFGQIGTTSTYLSTFTGTINIASGTYDLDYKFGVQQSAIPNYITPLNTYQNTFVSLCQYAKDIIQANGVNNLLQLTLPTPYGTNGCNILVTSSIISVWYSYKFTTILNIVNGQPSIMTNSESLVQMFNPYGVLQNASLDIDSDNNVYIVNQINTGSGPTYSNNTCSVKAKLLIVNY